MVRMTAFYFGLMVFCNIFFIYVFFGGLAGEKLGDSVKESKIALYLGTIAGLIVFLCSLL